jgi:hypothetical protein
MGLLHDFRTPPAGYSPRKLGALAALGFVLSAFALVPTVNPDYGIPDESAMASAHGRVIGVHRYKSGVRFRLSGRDENFEYPSKSRGSGIVESALRSAGNDEVAVLFNPKFHAPMFSSDSYYDVWQIYIDGKRVRTVEDSVDGWRSDNRIAPWLFSVFLTMSIYLAWIARRAYRKRLL